MSEAVLVALGDLTNGALNYYQTTHVVMAKRKIIETYIEQLQQENNQLKKQLEYLRSGEYLNQLKFERNMLEDIVQNTEVSKEDKNLLI